MAAGLQDLLVALHDCLQGGDVVTAAERAHDIVGDIGHHVLQDVSDKQMDYCCSVLFDKDSGVVPFLKKTVSQDEFQYSKAELLIMLLSFVQKREKKIMPYAVDIKDVCISLFTRDRLSRVKSGAIPLLIEVIMQTSGSKLAEELQVGKLIEKFFMELTKSVTKHTPTVKAQIYHLLGVFAEVYPELMVNYAEKLLDLYMRTLREQMTSKTKKPELSIIAGCLLGLTCLLVHFTHSAEEGGKHSYDIFKYTKHAISKDVQLTRFDMPRAGLKLLAKHACQLDQYLIDDHQGMYENLAYWSSHHNREMQHLGVVALEAFLKQISEMLVEQARRGRRDGATFKFFIQQFRAIMDNPQSTNKEINLAIRGYGFFAAPCKLFLSTDDVKFMFNEMIQRSEQVFFGQSEELDDKLINLPSFLEALASIVTHLEAITENFLMSLERLVVILIESYPKLHEKLHYGSFLALLKVFFALSGNGAVFRGFLSRVVYQGLIRTCSHPVILDTEEQMDAPESEEEVVAKDKQKVSYKDYIKLWSTLLNSAAIKELAQLEISLEERHALTEAIYDEMINSVLKMVERLDLTSNRATDEEAEAEPGTSAETSQSPDSTSADPVQGLQPVRPKDFIIFINLVDFSRDLFPMKHVQLFNKWAFTFGREVILQSTRLPLVSGFYKLLSVCMKICSKTAYFKDVGVKQEWRGAATLAIKQEDSEPNSMEVEDTATGDLAQREACFLLFTKFTKEVLTRMKQYKDELLASCLVFILSLPKEVVLADLPAIIPAVKTALRIGQSYLPLALAGLDALEHWAHTLPQHILQPYYKEILPCLDAYLRTSLNSGSDIAGGDQTMSMTSRNPGKKIGRKKIPVKLLKKKKSDMVSKNQESQLAQVKQRCVFMLGSLGGAVNSVLVSTETEDVTQNAVAWDTVKHLKFEMPFMDIKPTIYFDAFLPRLVQLASTSSERQTKVAACELLHSMVLYMLGRGAQQPGGRGRATAEKEPMDALYRKLFPVVMQLACDVEQVAKDLFEPLLMQLIHWFTSSKKFESPDVRALLDTLLDGLVCPTDTALRDISARAVKEYFKWSVKQSTKKQLEKNPVNVISLFKRVYSLARHPSAFKRLGAALAINNIYTIFREEDCLVDMFTFEILVVFVESLAIAHTDDKSLGTQEQCKQVLGHLERIIKVKSKLLIAESKTRKEPKGWTAVTLVTCMKWLLRQCGRPQTECRHVCMELVFKLAPCVEGATVPKDFFDALLDDHDASYFIQRFECGLYKTAGGKSGLLRRPTMAHMEVAFSLKTALNWFDLVLAALDCYSWVFGEKLLNPSKTLLIAENKGTVIFQVMTHFFDTLALEDIHAAAKLFKSQPAADVFTPREIDEYNRAKCTVLVRVMNFLCVMLGGYRSESMKIFPGNFFSPKMWNAMVSCVLEPTAVGFNMGDLEVMMQLPGETQQLLMVFNRYLPANLSKAFNKELAAKISKNSPCDLFGKLPLPIHESSQDFVRLSHLVSGYEQLQKTGMLAEALKDGRMTQKFADQLLDCVFKGIVIRVDGKPTAARLEPTSHSLAERLLTLAFLLGIKTPRLLNLLLDKTELLSAGSKSTCYHGSIFYATFKSVINTHLVAVAKDLLPELIRHAQTEWCIVGNILMGMVDQVGRDRQLRKKEGTKLVDLVLAQWSQLSSWWSGGPATQETKSQTLSLLTKIVVINSNVLSDGKHAAFSDIFAMYLDLLTDTRTALAFKSRVMDLLPFFAALPERETKQLKSRLDRLVADNFPARSTEYEVGSPKYNDYVTALKKIMYAMELSGSLTLLELLISIMCKESRHVYEEEIQSSLARFVKRLARDKHKAAADVGYQIFINDKRFTNDQRRSALERVCLSVLRLVHVPALTLFFMDHIVQIVDIIESKQVKGSEPALETQAVSKMCCLQLVEIMYSRLSKEDIFSKSSKINEAFCHNKVETGKELTTRVMKTANAVKSEDMRGETILLDLRRQLHCAAYNALIAIVCCTQTDMKFYKGFLFQDDTAKGQFLLDNLIDKDRSYTFEVEMSTPLARRKKFVSIRNEVRENRAGEAEEEGHYTTSVHYLASQYLADSSLGADVSQFDFGSSVQASAFSMSSAGSQATLGGYERVYKRESSSKDNVLEAVVTVKDDYVEMEMDELNQHECMACMTALLQHMHRNNITPPVDKGETPSEMPGWMGYLHRKLQSNDTARNIKLFICKLLVNAEEVFRPYAKFWLAPAVMFITRGDSGVEGIHYFITDLVVTILSWHTVAIPEDTSVDRAMSSRLAEFLMTYCHHDNRQLLRNNLEVLKTLVEVWKNTIDVPSMVCFQNFTDKDPKTTKNGTGLQMVGVLLANKLSPFRAGTGVDKEKFYRMLAMNMMKDYKAVYAPAAEVVGMALKHLSDTEKSAESKKYMESYVDNLVKMLLSFHGAKPDQFITCVHKMTRHYPAVADKFLGKMLFMLPKLHGEFKTHCLEVILSRLGSVDNAFVEMKNKGITDILKHRDENMQTVALKMVHAMLPHLAPTDLLYLLPSVTSFTGVSSAPCRAVMYDILMWVYDNHRDEVNDLTNQIITLTKECLLQGLSDDDLKNRLTIQNFWSHETRLPTGTLDRLVAMLEAMYSPSTEAQYLGYATNLLLEMTSKSPDYNREIFEHPLSECKFEDYNVTSSWRRRHAAMTPLFAQTQGSQMSGSQSETMDDSMGSVQIRATQDVQQFSATQDVGGGGRGPYNWLTQSSMDTYSDYSQSLPSESQSSLLFTVGKAGSKPGGKRTAAQVGPGFGKDRMGGKKDQVDGRDESSSQSSEILRLKKRFIRDQQATKVFFMKRASRMQKFREEVQREQKQRREHQVTMYRKYRTGELPDIQIKYSYIIAPLQALAQKDNAIARLLFSAIFKAIFAKIEDEKTDREARETVEKINECLNNVLANSTQYHPPFIGCVLDIAQEYPKRISLKPENIHTACTTSLQQPLGIVLMEDMLIQSAGETERPQKRARGAIAGSSASVSKETSTWVELARLYKSLGDYDVLRGIFSSKFGTQKLTMEAMDAEMRGDYQAALKLYNKGLGVSEDDWEDDRPNEVEMDLWEDSRLQCYDNLTEWDNLETATTASIDEARNLDKVWDDTYLQDHQLPFLLRGKLKLLLAGDEKQETLLKFVDRAVKIPERKALLESQYCEELSLMYVWQEDYDRARHYASSAIDLFLRDWSGIDSLMANSRTAKLQTLQKLTELQEFLDFMAKESNFASNKPCYHLVDRWLNRSPDSLMDPPGIWDDVITNRCVFIDLISSRLESSNQSMEVDGNDEEDGALRGLDHRKALLQLAQADSCREQDNFPVSLKILKKTLPTVKHLRDESLHVKWTHTYSRTHQRKCLVSDLDLQEKVNALAGTLDNLAKHDHSKALAASYSLGQQHNILKGGVIKIAAQLLQSDVPDFGALGDRVKDKLHAMAGCNKTKSEEVVNCLIEKGYQYMKTAAGLAGQEQDVDPSAPGINQSLMALVKYCDTYLRQAEDDGEESPLHCASFDSFPTAIVTCLLQAMRNNSVDARQRFARLLQIIDYYPETMDTFIRKSREVPSWMFLGWISQMTALLDKPESPAIHDILLNVAQEYPNAMLYPFRMSSEGYKFTNDKVGKKSQEVRDRLGNLLSRNKLVELFIQALEQFGQPNSLFRDWVAEGEIHKLLKTKNVAKIKACYKKMYEDLMNTQGVPDSEDDLYGTQGTAGSSLPSFVGMGAYRRRFAQAFAKDMDKLFGKDGNKIPGLSLKEFSNIAKDLGIKMDTEVREKLIPPKSLKEYSKFLAEFEATSSELELEIPGQYTGTQKPMPEYHTKVSSFDERVMVMSSIRKPKTLTIRGNDEKEYMYLVKGGEDLRLDQRIEQLFQIMNEVFVQDSVCRRRRLYLRTYQVVPMTPRVGFIEWMGHTTPLKNLLYDALTDAEAKFLSSHHGPGTLHGEWIGGNKPAHYFEAYKKYNRTEATTAFRKRENLVPWDLLRRAYLRMSASSEAFFTLKGNFAVSHAQVSICQYILGIGDRHLSNFMVDTETGKMVGIDFGHAFGSATQFLPIPELMPFRMTRQIRQLMMPLKEKGLMEGTMVHTLRALRNNSDLLLNTMDVFIKEPSVDWKQNAEKQMKSMDRIGMEVDELEGDQEWYPKQKVEYARKKLNGHNPVYITRNELQLGHMKTPYYKHFDKVLMGDKELDIRARLPRQNLTAEQQVACLLNQATDPNILGRVWTGWESWM